MIKFGRRAVKRRKTNPTDGALEGAQAAQPITPVASIAEPFNNKNRSYPHEIMLQIVKPVFTHEQQPVVLDFAPEPRTRLGRAKRSPRLLDILRVNLPFYDASVEAYYGGNQFYLSSGALLDEFVTHIGIDRRRHVKSIMLPSAWDVKRTRKAWPSIVALAFSGSERACRRRYRDSPRPTVLAFPEETALSIPESINELVSLQKVTIAVKAQYPDVPDAWTRCSPMERSAVETDIEEAIQEAWEDVMADRGIELKVVHVSMLPGETG